MVLPSIRDAANEIFPVRPLSPELKKVEKEEIFLVPRFASARVFAGFCVRVCKVTSEKRAPPSPSETGPAARDSAISFFSRSLSQTIPARSSS